MGEHHILFDTEANDLLENASTIHCIGILDLKSNHYHAYYGDELPDAFFRIQEAQIVVGHNIAEYDLPLIEKLTGGLVRFDYSRVVDTLKLSRLLMPGLGSHKLAKWGDLLGYPKLDFHDFENFTPEMLTYMRRDVLLNAKVYHMLMSLLNNDVEGTR